LHQTPLSLATLANNPRLVRLLVDRGATVNAQVYENGCHGSGPFCAAVHVASSHGLLYLDTLAELLKSPNVDLAVIDSQGSVYMSLSVFTTRCTIAQSAVLRLPVARLSVRPSVFCLRR